MKYISLAMTALFLVPSLSFAQTLTPEQRESILQEIASLESQMIILLQAQLTSQTATTTLPVASTVDPSTASSIDALNAQIAADQKDMQNKKNDSRLGGCNEEFGGGQIITRMNQMDSFNCEEWQSEDSAAEAADQIQITADEKEIASLTAA